jgi:chemotaxis protein methyltransferase WspC
MSDPLVHEVARLLGLDIDSVGVSHVESALRAARDRVARQLPPGERNRALEIHELLEAIVVPESWFFRDEAPFVQLARHCAAEPGRVRILSAPCARGEEVWSAAMTLARSGRQSDQMEVVGIDVSARSIRVARNGVYGGMSLRGAAAQLAAPWMETTPEGMRVSNTLRPAVSFEVANMAQPLPWAGVSGTFDVIMCRNLLIYLTPDVRLQLVRNLRDLLRPGGILLCGHAEGSIFLQHGWTRDGAPESSAFRPPTEVTARTRPTERKHGADRSPPFPSYSASTAAMDYNTDVQGHPVVAPARLSQPRVTEPVARWTPVAATPPIRLPDQSAREVERARAFADAGLYREAAGILGALLSENPELTEAWILLGLCELAQNNVPAAQIAYRQALVHEPQSVHAIEGMAIVADRTGRPELSASYRRRAAALRGEPV